MAQHGQVLKLRSCRSDGKARWAYRYRVDGSFSKRPQVGGFATRDEAERALKRELARLRPGREMTVTELVEEYLKIHQAAPSTIEKLKTTVYVATHEQEDLLTAWEVVRRHFSDHDAPSTLLGVSVLGYRDQLVEVEAVAALSH